LYDVFVKATVPEPPPIVLDKGKDKSMEIYQSLRSSLPLEDLPYAITVY